jgi:hypothetical protein
MLNRALLPAALLVSMAACGGAAQPVGYLKSDVAEPDSMYNPVAEGIRLQGPLFQEGTLTFEGKGTIEEVFMRYIEKMQALGWAPFSTQQDPETGMSAKLVKDIRLADVAVSKGERYAVRVTIRVGPNMQR